MTVIGRLRLDRFMVSIVAACGVLLTLAVVIGFVLPSPGATRPRDTAAPEGVVFSWVEAHRAGDLDRAYSLLSPRLQSEEGLDGYRLRRADAFGPAGERQVQIDAVDIGPTQAHVRVTTGRFQAGYRPFTSNIEHTAGSVYLVQEAGGWRIDRVEPWPQ